MSRNERRALIAAAAAIGLSMTPADAARLVEPTGYAEMRQLVEAHPEIDRAIFPGLSAAPLLMGGKKAGLKVQDVFNTSLWTGTGAARTITTGIDSGEGSLVWIKSRSAAISNAVSDTLRGTNVLFTDLTSAQVDIPSWVTSFSSTGYGLGTSNVNTSGNTYVGWQFRRAEKFFDIVQYTGNGVAGRQIAHNLGIAPGMVVVKSTSTGGQWWVYHRAMGATKYAMLNSRNGEATGPVWADTSPTSTHFSVAANGWGSNETGESFIAYIFAHDPSADGLIQCFSKTISGTENDPIITGWPAQFVMFRRTVSDSWFMMDKARNPGWAGPDLYLQANSADPEVSPGAFHFIANRPDGFDLNGYSIAGQTVFGVAIREAV